MKVLIGETDVITSITASPILVKMYVSRRSKLMSLSLSQG